MQALCVALPLNPPTIVGTSGKKPQTKNTKSIKVPKRYTEHFGAVSDPASLVGTPMILNSSGSPQCAMLLKKFAAAPPTVPDGTIANGWQRGISLTNTTVATLQVGTPIATGWNADGFYPNNNTGQHSGIFSGKFNDNNGNIIGFTIVEQYSGLDTIISRVVYFDPFSMKKKNTYFYRGLDYASVKW